jgi:cytochrome b6-f complex iron-sulfur subunit/menaquinol-cytochrome c reductase iron-sulfur subunit
VVLGSAAYAAAVAVPAAGFVAAKNAGATDDQRWKRVAPLGALPEGTPTRVKVRGDIHDAFTTTRDQTLGSVWLTKTGTAVRALSAECPHLGCAIDLDGDGKAFACPCHTSRFSLDGRSESGPSPRAMDELATRIVDGWVEVEMRRFRQGGTEKVEVG